MKAIPFLLLVFLCITFSGASFSQEKNEKKRIYIASTDFSALTNVQVTCSAFENNFAGRIKVKEIDNIDTLQKLDLFLGKVKYAKKYEDIDARAKFIYERENGIK